MTENTVSRAAGSLRWSVRTRFGADNTSRVRLNSATSPAHCQTPRYIAREVVQRAGLRENRPPAELARPIAAKPRGQKA